MDQEFLAHPLRELAAAALQAARDRGAGHADFRAERIRGQQVRLSDGKLETLADSDDIGLAVRVVVDGTWGFAATVDLTPEAAAHAAAAAGRTLTWVYSPAGAGAFFSDPVSANSNRL